MCISDALIEEGCIKFFFVPQHEESIVFIRTCMHTYHYYKFEFILKRRAYKVLCPSSGGGEPLNLKEVAIVVPWFTWTALLAPNSDALSNRDWKAVSVIWASSRTLE